MNEITEKRLVVFTSQSLRQYGIRAVRMDDIAHNMAISKRTIYEIYASKDNLINTCLESYLNRIENLFHIIRYNSSESLICLWKIAKAYIENLYKAECAFWLDVEQCLEYKYIYAAYNRIWSAELSRTIVACQEEKYIINNLNIQLFLESFTTLLYNARITGCLPTMLHCSAYYMLRGIMTNQGIELFEEKKKLR
ncbi:TetR/AcrR family transcriptional regulator [Bacteroides sp.]